MFMDNKIFVIDSNECTVTFIIITHLRGLALQWVIPCIENDRPCSAITGASWLRWSGCLGSRRTRISRLPALCTWWRGSRMMGCTSCHRWPCKSMPLESPGPPVNLSSASFPPLFQEYLSRLLLLCPLGLDVDGAHHFSSVTSPAIPMHIYLDSVLDTSSKPAFHYTQGRHPSPAAAHCLLTHQWPAQIFQCTCPASVAYTTIHDWLLFLMIWAHLRGTWAGHSSWPLI